MSNAIAGTESDDAAVAVSIILPVYNGERYLHQALDSVLQQSLHEIEVLCVDDGSTDGTAAILRVYQEKDARIRVFRQENAGAGPARNRALAEASGEYVAFLDADDYYLGTEQLERLYRAAHAHAADVAACRMMEERYGRLMPREAFEEIDVTDEAGAWVSFRDYQDDYNYQAYLFRRTFLKTHDIHFPAYRRYQDPPFLLGVLHAAGRVWFLQGMLYVYHWDPLIREKSAAYVADLLRGIGENLRVAWREGYDKLAARLLRRLDDDYADAIRQGDKEALQVALAIETKHLQQPGANPIRVFADLHARLASETAARKAKYRFPSELFPHGTRLVIYGAGDVGRDFARQLQGREDIMLVGLVDRNAARIHIPDVRVFPVEALSSLTYDAVLIAVKNPEVASDIQKDLVAQGVPSAKLHWTAYDAEKTQSIINRDKG